MRFLLSLHTRFQGRQPMNFLLNHISAVIKKNGFQSTFSEYPKSNELDQVDMRYESAECTADDSNTITEEEMGIQQFVSYHKRFCGILKHLCSDFSVREITSTGEVVRLTSLDTNIKYDSLKPVTNISKNQEKLMAIMKDYLTEDVVHKVIDFTVDASATSLVVDISHLSTGAQSRLLTCFQLKQFAMTNLIMKIITTDGRKCLKLTKSGTHVPVTDEQMQSKSTNEVTNNYPYLSFVLYKENVPGFDAYSKISHVLKLPVSRLFTAGLKDKRAVTCQIATVQKARIKTKNLEKVNAIPNIKIGNVQSKEKGVQMGDLYGNRFEIIVREIEAHEDTIQIAVGNLATSGFINYFGLQRFGNRSGNCKDIGKKLLQEDWDGAVQDILKPRDYPELEKRMESRRIWSETQDAEKAFNALHFHDRKTREGLLLKGLICAGPMEALKSLPMIYMQFYINSYVSFLWNHVVSKRIERYGTEVVLGDMVECGSNADNPIKQLTLVTSETKQNYKLNIFDVIVPVIGTNYPIPNNEDGVVYQELLDRDGLTQHMVQYNEMFTNRGAYRYMVALPENLQWSILYYDHIDQSLLQTDYEKLQSIELGESVSCGERKALKLQFDLKSSCYATMAIRELLKKQSISE